MEHLLNISPIDGRYKNITNIFSEYFSEFGFTKYRLYIELIYFISLIEVLPELDCLNNKKVSY